MVFAKPISIAIVVLVASATISWVVRRAIGRFVGAMVGEENTSRRLKRRLRRHEGRRGAARPPCSTPARSPSGRRPGPRRSARCCGRWRRSSIWGLALITILGELGISLGPLIAGAGLAGVAIGFGAQSLVKDFLAGIFILVEDQYGVGDIVDVGEATGTIEAVSLRTTRLRDVNGTVWHVPNGQILRVGNKSQQWARALLDLAVAHDTDVATAERVIKADRRRRVEGPGLGRSDPRGARGVGRRAHRPRGRDPAPRREDAPRQAVRHHARAPRPHQGRPRRRRRRSCPAPPRPSTSQRPRQEARRRRSRPPRRPAPRKTP